MRFKIVKCMFFLIPMIYFLTTQNSLTQELKQPTSAKKVDLVALERTKILSPLYFQNSRNKNFLKDSQSTSSAVRDEYKPILEKIAKGNYMGKSINEVNRLLNTIQPSKDRAKAIDVAIAMKEDIKIFPKGCYEEAFLEHKDAIERVSRLNWKTDNVRKEDAATLIKVQLALLINQAKLLQIAQEKFATGRFLVAFRQYKKEITGLANKDWRTDEEAKGEEGAIIMVISANAVDLANALQSVFGSVTAPRFLEVFKANATTIENTARKNWQTDEFTWEEFKALIDVYNSYTEK